MSGVSFSVFTKPWRKETIAELGAFLSGLGFDGIEFPLRPGYQIEPEEAEQGLPRLVKQLGDFGLAVTSVASQPDEAVFAGCQAAGIPILRIMARYDLNGDYLTYAAEKRRELEGLTKLCRKYEVKLAVQHHCGPGVNNAMELRHLVKPFDPQWIGAIWDAAHSALAGEEPEQSLDIVWSHLCMTNLKNAFYLRTNGPEADQAAWSRYFTTGTQGLSSWPRIAAYLTQRDYQGVVCLTAEYTDEKRVNALIARDINYARSLFSSDQS